VFAVTYHYGNSQELYFKSTFTMMVKSFSLTKKAQSANDADVSDDSTTADANTTTNANENSNSNTATDNTNTN
jgi:hypothetical protein